MIISLFTLTYSSCYAFYGLNSDGQCVPCKSLSCFDCTQDYTKCNDCTLGFIDNDKKSKTKGMCTSKADFNCLNKNFEECKECETGFGVKDKKKCVKCEVSNCISCGKNYKICDNCNYPYSADINTQSSTYGKCITASLPNCNKVETNDASKCKECNIGFYNSKGICNECSTPNCIKCSSKGCEECKDGYDLKNGECVECNIPNCAKCGSGSFCSKCKDGYAYIDTSSGKCESASTSNCYKINENHECIYCNKGYGFDSNNNCVKCEDPHCVECPYDYQTCLACYDKKDEDQGGPYSPYHLNVFTGKCTLSCDDPNCNACSRDDNKHCRSCQNGYYARSGSCWYGNVNNCNITYDGKHCNECMPGYGFDSTAHMSNYCTKCDEKSCKHCDDEEYCNECYEGYYKSKGKCIQCNHLNCKECTDYRCTLCLDGYGFSWKKNSKSYGSCFPCGVRGCSVCEDNACKKCEDGSDPVDNQCPYDDGDDDGKLSTTIIIIIVVCCVVVVGIIIGVIVYCVLKRKSKVGQSSDGQK